MQAPLALSLLQLRDLLMLLRVVPQCCCCGYYWLMRLELTVAS